jgi:hypothetical protein
MALDIARARQHLRNFDFQTLFIEELGWDRHQMQPLAIQVDGVTYNLHALVEKRGLVTFLCDPDPQGRIPAYATRRKLETQVAKSVHEHLIIYGDAAQTTQTWQWVKREPGKPLACREHTYHRDQPGDALIQKLQTLAIDLQEEEDLTIFDVTQKVRQGFYAEKVTKKFYDLFKTEHEAFLRFIQGIPDDEFQRCSRAGTFLRRLPLAPGRAPLRADNEINPDVLGYIFEKYINQKQMGAYYTKEDITELHRQEHHHPLPVRRRGKEVRHRLQAGRAVWRLLREIPTATSTTPCARGWTWSCPCRRTSPPAQGRRQARRLEQARPRCRIRPAHRDLARARRPAPALPGISEKLAAGEVTPSTT